MASFVAEVLSSAGQMEREEINEKLSMLGRRMDNLKQELHTAITSATATFADFEPSFDVTATLTDKVKAISDEMQELSLKVENEVKGQLNISTGEFQSLTRQLEQVTMVTQVLDKLTLAQQLMENIATATSEGKYSEASASLMRLEEALKQPVCEREDEIRIMKAVRIQVEVLKQKLIQDLNNAWKETIFWTSVDGPAKADKASKANKAAKSETKEGAPQEEDVRQWELRLPKSDSTAEQQTLSEMVTALEQLGQLDGKLRSLGQHLVQNIFALTLCWQKVVVTETPLATGKQVIVKAASERKLPNCLDVFSIVGNVLDLLKDSVLHVQVTRQVGEDGQDCQVSLMNLVGDEIGEKVLDSIVKDCLSHAIPSTNKELETFHEVIAVTTRFQEKLVAVGFISGDSRTLQDYVENVNVLFANKKCQSILERARGLMTTDIHDTVLISSDASPGELVPLDKAGGPSKEKSRKMEMAGDPLLTESTFRMPTCRISVCIQELLDLAYSTLSEASSSSPQCAVQMFYAVHNIFELFCSVFPTYHAHSLANFPQLTALHHNNCMYLAHHLLTLGHQFKHSLPSNVCASFVDLIQEVRNLGTSCFLEQMNTQKAILEQYLHGAGFAAMDEESNYESAEKALKQALHQLTHLQRVWQDVLPVSVYCKAIGILLNSLLKQIMDHLTSLEDISSEAARKLFLLLKMVEDKAVTLFLWEQEGGDPKSSSSSKARVDLHRHVSKFPKFSEIQLVLNGSLQEIADRWADGMGPLAAEFPPNELKQLIRALFQNTDRRAAVLAKIK